MGDSNKVSARTFTDVVSSDGGGNKMWENCVFIVLIGSRVQCAPLSIEDANMTAFFFSPPLSLTRSPLWSRGPARYLMEKYWIWCVVETVHNPVKSFRKDFSKGVWVFTQQHCLPLIFFMSRSATPQKHVANPLWHFEVVCWSNAVCAESPQLCFLLCCIGKQMTCCPFHVLHISVIAAKPCS